MLDRDNIDDILSKLSGELVEGIFLNTDLNEMQSTLDELAALLWMLYSSFVRVGFKEEQAMYLCSEMLTIIGGKQE